MRIVFLGFQKWGWAALKGLIESKHQVVLVITHSQNKSVYRGSFIDKSVKELAESNDITTLECKRLNEEEIINKIKDANPDVIVSSDWETWIAPEVTRLAKKAAINIHDALLPKYAGFSPVNWAIINGEKEVGITVHYIEEILDQGKIILQEAVLVQESDTVVEVLEKIFEKIPAVALKSLDLIENDRVEAKKQDLNQASFYHKITGKDCEINWQNSYKAVYNFIRALFDPFSNAYTYFQGKKIKIKKASIPKKVYCGIPGRLACRQENGVVALCGNTGVNQPQGIVIEEVEDEQGKVIPANRY
ncbi:MAG: methionyl-tRNA formyltransferase, partial [Candidatus Omnitrophica bacterium]|nr:methionyl-tRNA formyltransferase [Candidatus Omnitrophota bacterium]